MFKIGNELMNKIKQAITPKKLVQVSASFSAGCYGCSNVCTSNCGNNCISSCSSGCGTSCAGKNSR